MKFTFAIIAALFFSGLVASAQTTITTNANGSVTTTIYTNAPNSTGFAEDLSQMYKDTLGSSNCSYAAFYGQKINGNAKAAGGLIAYNIANHVGLVAGIDHLWCSGAAPSTFTLSGGLQLNADFDLGAWFGLTNAVIAHPVAMTLVGAPMNGGNGGNVMNLNRAGAFFSSPISSKLSLQYGAVYGNRTGCGTAYDGNWVDVFLSLSWKLPKS